MLEIEVKYRVHEPQLEAVKDKITSLKLKQRTASRQVDAIYLKEPHTSFTTFTQGDPVARVRVDGENISMTVKKSVDDATRIEHETSCGDYEVACKIFETLGYNRVVEVDKERTEHVSDDVIITLDKVKGLGHFIEIEVLAQDASQKDAATAKIASVAKSLGLSDDMIELQKYDELLAATVG